MTSSQTDSMDSWARQAGDAMTTERLEAQNAELLGRQERVLGHLNRLRGSAQAMVEAAHDTTPEGLERLGRDMLQRIDGALADLRPEEGE